MKYEVLWGMGSRAGEDTNDARQADEKTAVKRTREERPLEASLHGGKGRCNHHGAVEAIKITHVNIEGGMKEGSLPAVPRNL